MTAPDRSLESAPILGESVATLAPLVDRSDYLQRGPREPLVNAVMPFRLLFLTLVELFDENSFRSSEDAMLVLRTRSVCLASCSTAAR